jgi:hypothetical protein
MPASTFRTRTALLAIPLLASAMHPIDEANRLQPEHLPTPFSAAQIRTACPAGRVIIFRIEQAGKEPFLQISTFAAATETDVRITAHMETPAGTPLGEPREMRSPWRDLQAHASFPAAVTTVSEETVSVPAGTFRCWIFTVQTAPDTVQCLAFAQDLPGPPIRMTITRAGAEVFNLVLLENRLPSPRARGYGSGVISIRMKAPAASRSTAKLRYSQPASSTGKPGNTSVPTSRTMRAEPVKSWLSVPMIR